MRPFNGIPGDMHSYTRPEYEGDTTPVRKLIAEAESLETHNSGIASRLHALKLALSGYHRYKLASKKETAWKWVVDEMANLSIHLSMSDQWKKSQAKVVP